MTIAAVILAAGLSSRMGESKPLLSLGDRSLLAHCRAVFAACGLTEILVVVGHRGEATAAAAEALGLRRVVNGEYRRGMFSSIQCGVAALPGDIDAFFVLPVDIPLVRSATVEALLAAASDPETVLHPVFAGRRGHPPLIPAALIPSILAHDGAGGLKGLLGRHKGMEVRVWDEGILLDADTPDDLAVLARRLARITIPTRPEAEALATMLLSEAGLVHGRLVGRAAVALAESLNTRGYELDLDLVYGAALLHDVAKGQPEHERRGAEMLSALGLGEIAAIVAVHNDAGSAAAVGLAATARPGEKDIVWFADRLFRGPHRVDIELRYANKLAAVGNDATARREILDGRNRALAVQALVERAAGDLETILAAAGV